jgi:hypothetical protein
MYIYNREAQATGKEFVYINTRTNSARLQEGLIGFATVDPAKARTEFRAAMNATTKLVIDQLARYRAASQMPPKTPSQLPVRFSPVYYLRSL